MLTLASSTCQLEVVPTLVIVPKILLLIADDCLFGITFSSTSSSFQYHGLVRLVGVDVVEIVS